jgi:hypothetical protein
MSERRARRVILGARDVISFLCTSNGISFCSFHRSLYHYLVGIHLRGPGVFAVCQPYTLFQKCLRSYPRLVTPRKLSGSDIPDTLPGGLYVILLNMAASVTETENDTLRVLVWLNGIVEAFDDEEKLSIKTLTEVIAMHPNVDSTVGQVYSY